MDPIKRVVSSLRIFLRNSSNLICHQIAMTALLAIRMKLKTYLVSVQYFRSVKLLKYCISPCPDDNPSCVLISCAADLGGFRVFLIPLQIYWELHWYSETKCASDTIWVYRYSTCNFCNEIVHVSESACIPRVKTNYQQLVRTLNFLLPGVHKAMLSIWTSVKPLAELTISHWSFNYRRSVFLLS